MAAGLRGQDCFQLLHGVPDGIVDDGILIVLCLTAFLQRDMQASGGNVRRRVAAPGQPALQLGIGRRER